jgi:hypothetical protein
LILVTAVVPVAIAAASVQSFHDWWYAMVTYRDQADSILTRSVHTRLHEARVSLPAFERGLGVLIVLAVVGWRRRPPVVALWLLFAAIGVVGGGNFHDHYYQQLVPPLAVLAGVGGLVLWQRRSAFWIALTATALAGTLWVTVPLWFDSSTAQAHAVFPDDPHLERDAAIVRYLDTHSRPEERVFVLWAAADIYYLADRAPAYRYMWFRNIQAIPGALGQVQRLLAGPHPPALVIGVNPPKLLDKSGKTARILKRRYRRVASVEGVPIYAPLP